MSHWHNAENWPGPWGYRNKHTPTPNQRAILGYLADGTARTAREVTNATGQPNGSTRARLKALAMRGLLFAEIPDDTNVLTYRITEKGTAVLESEANP